MSDTSSKQTRIGGENREALQRDFRSVKRRLSCSQVREFAKELRLRKPAEDLRPGYAKGVDVTREAWSCRLSHREASAVGRQTSLWTQAGF